MTVVVDVDAAVAAVARAVAGAGVADADADADDADAVRPDCAYDRRCPCLDQDGEETRKSHELGSLLWSATAAYAAPAKEDALQLMKANLSTFCYRRLEPKPEEM